MVVGCQYYSMWDRKVHHQTSLNVTGNEIFVDRGRPHGFGHIVYFLPEFKKSGLCYRSIHHVRREVICLKTELMSSLSEHHHLQTHMTCSVTLGCPSPLCFVSRLRMEEAGGTLWNRTDIYNLSNLPLLPTPAESPPLNNSHRRRSNMDMLVHISPPSLCNTFHCLFPSVLCPLSLCTPPPPCLSSLGSERRTMNWFFLVGKLSVCKTAQADYSSECKMMDRHETTH